MQLLLKLIIDQVLTRLLEWATALVKKLSRRKEVKDQADASVKPLIDAKTPEEVRDATKDALDGF